MSSLVSRFIEAYAGTALPAHVLTVHTGDRPNE